MARMALAYRIVTALSPLLLAACGNVLGDSDYGCKGMPEGVRCLGAREVYEMTEERDQLGKTNADGRREREDEVMMPTFANARIGQMPLPDLAAGKVVLRTPAKVLRVLVSPYEDDGGYLHMPGLVYAEVAPRRWQVGTAPSQDLGTLRPLDTGRTHDDQQAAPAPSKPIDTAKAGKPAKPENKGKGGDNATK